MIGEREGVEQGSRCATGRPPSPAQDGADRPFLHGTRQRWTPLHSPAGSLLASVLCGTPHVANHVPTNSHRSPRPEQRSSRAQHSEPAPRLWACVGRHDPPSQSPRSCIAAHPEHPMLASVRVWERMAGCIVYGSGDAGDALGADLVWVPPHEAESKQSIGQPLIHAPCQRHPSETYSCTGSRPFPDSPLQRRNYNRIEGVEGSLRVMPTGIPGLAWRPCSAQSGGGVAIAKAVPSTTLSCQVGNWVIVLLVLGHSQCWSPCVTGANPPRHLLSSPGRPWPTCAGQPGEARRLPACFWNGNPLCPATELDRGGEHAAQ